MIEFQLPNFCELTVDGKRLLLERTVKHKGIWRVHQNDPDDIFLSDPHADRVDESEKLDLYTGNVYDKKTKALLYKLPAKAMKFIYNKLIVSPEDSITKKLNSNKNLIEYL